MAYVDDEVSVHDGEPVELYEFIGPNTTYRYTSAERAIVYLAQTFQPSPGLKRSAVGGGSTNDAVALVVSLRCAEQVVADYGFTIPPANLRLRVHRRQAVSGEVRIIWDGTVVGISSQGHMASLRSTSALGERLRTSLPSVSIQYFCNHFLYDPRCRVDRATYDFAETVASSSGKTLTLGSIGIAPDQWFRAGEIVRDADGERRMIVSQFGAVLTLHSEFRVIAPGDAVTLYAGCDHTVITCSDKFNNVVNFGGHPTVPPSNPFIVGLRLARNA